MTLRNRAARAPRALYRSYPWVAAVVTLLSCSTSAHAQLMGPADVRPGSEFERYLRIAQLVGAASPTPWMIRPWSPDAQRGAVTGLGPAHPWSARIRPDSVRRIAFIAPAIDGIANSALALGRPAGPAWAGKGVTLVASGGVQFGLPTKRFLPALTVRVAPVVFWSQNLSFDPAPSSASGEARFRDGLRPGVIDLPQRFGERPFGRVDLGDSEVQLTLAGWSITVGNAPQQFGPMPTQAVVLAPNGGGFPNLSVGTASWQRIPFLGKVSVRAEAGRIDASNVAPHYGGSAETARLASALAIGWQPWDSPVVEFVATEFVHRAWPAGGIKPQDIFLASRLLVGGGRSTSANDIDENIRDNQLASLGVRVAVPGHGIEAFAEVMRNDAARDLFDLLTEPDHDIVLAYGFQRVIARGTRWHVVRAEIVDGSPNPSSRIRPEVTAYEHSSVVQGHTVRGELLGASLLERNGGALVGWDVYDAAGRRTFELQRVLLPNELGEGTTAALARARYTLTWERLGLRSNPHWRVLAAIDIDVNREPGRDATNVRFSVGYRP